ncbi:Kcnh2 [Symbiodinium natans]|uniref:Kcnh2 protein n=1 Tax=Symbiodinium natans TaxID=878477 RepID=A0A812LLH4_9DINO|nr:Kcnh2 [Symbiodinium natans]
MFNFLFRTKRHGEEESFLPMPTTSSREMSVSGKMMKEVSFDAERGTTSYRLHEEYEEDEAHLEAEEGRPVPPITHDRLSRDMKRILGQRSPIVSCNFNIAQASIRESHEAEVEAGDASAQCCKQLFSRFVVVPELGEHQKAKGYVHWVEVWDLWVTMLLFFMAYYLPLVQVIDTTRPPVHRTIRTISVLANMCFSLDIFLQFFIAYANPQSDLSRGPWQRDPCTIAKAYLGMGDTFGWFWLDLASITPFWVREVTGDKQFDQWQILGLIRSVKIFRMVNLPRLGRFMSRWHAKFGFSYYLIDMVKFIIITTLCAHWFACMWIAIEGTVTYGELSYHTKGSSWLSALIDTKGDPCSPSARKDPNCVYFMALYWATMTLTTVGYGDVTPQNPAEYLVCTLTMLVSGFVWAYIVGSVVSLIHNMDSNAAFKRNMDDLNDMMESRAIDQELRVRMRKYMHECIVAQQQASQESLLRNTISPGLQREVAQSSQRDLLKNIYWAQEFPDEASMELAKCFSPLFFGPNEVIMLRQAVLVIQKGLLGVRGRVLRRGDVWGIEGILLESQSLVSTYQPRTLAYCFVMCLHRDDLLEIARSFPEVDMILRRAQVRTAVRRAFLQTAEEKKLEEAGHHNIFRTRTETRGFVHNKCQTVSRLMDEATGSLSPRGGSAFRPNFSTRKGSGSGSLRGSFVSEKSVDSTGAGDGKNRTSRASRTFYVANPTPGTEDVRSSLGAITERLDKLEKDVGAKQDAILRQLHFLSHSARSERSVAPSGFR